MIPNSILIGVGFIAVGLLLIVLGFRKNKRCSGKTVGRITGVHEDVTTDDEGYHSYSYSPEFEYVVKGQVYRGTGNISYSKPKKIQIGGNIDVYYNPKKPEEHQTKGGGKTLPILGIAVIFLGVICIAGTFY